VRRKHDTDGRRSNKTTGRARPRRLRLTKSETRASCTAWIQGTHPVRDAQPTMHVPPPSVPQRGVGHGVFLRLRVPTQEHAHCTRASPVSSARRPSFGSTAVVGSLVVTRCSRRAPGRPACGVDCAVHTPFTLTHRAVRTRQRLPVSALPQGGTACIAPRTNTACCSRIASHPSMRAVIVASPRSNGRPGARPVRPLMQLYKVAA
jgi:hypothetical protein